MTPRLRSERWSEGVEYLNPDDVARDRFGDGIAFETVFSAPDKLDFVTRAKSRDYFIRVFFIGTSDPRINAARVADRVMRGGHTVPIDKISSRHEKSMAITEGGPAIAEAPLARSDPRSDLGVRRTYHGSG